MALKIVLATRNDGKIREINSILGGIGLEIMSLGDFPPYGEPEEDGKTFLENAMIKARAAVEATGLPALADDSGIEVDYLGGSPGVHSARYGGALLNDRQRCEKLLADLDGVPQEKRKANFRCVMVLYPDPTGRGAALSTEGILEGFISREPAGEDGFGYDPIFFVPGEGRTAAEMTMEEKNRISHRYRALVEMKALLAGRRGFEIE